MYKGINDPSVDTQIDSQQSPTIINSISTHSSSLYSGSSGSVEAKSLTQTASSSSGSGPAHFDDSNLTLSQDSFQSGSHNNKDKAKSSSSSSGHLDYSNLNLSEDIFQSGRHSSKDVLASTKIYPDSSKDLDSSNNKEDVIKGNSACFSFELSQDFSQRNKELAKKPLDLQYTSTSGSEEIAPTKKYISKDSKERKITEHDSKQEKIDKVKKLMGSLQLSLEDLLEDGPSCSKSDSSFTTVKCKNAKNAANHIDQVPSCSKSSGASYAEVKSANVGSEKEEKPLERECKEQVTNGGTETCSKNIPNQEIFKGNQVFAAWENEFFYPAVIESVNHKNQSVMVLFEDKYRKECDVNEVIYDKTFEQYQKVLVKSNTKKEKEYKEGVIIHCSRTGGEYMYWVLLENKKQIVVDRSALCFHRSYVKKRKMKLKVTMIPSAKPVRKRKLEPRSSSSSDTCNEPSPVKRKTTSALSPDKLFAGCHFLLTKAKAIAPCTDNGSGSEREDVELNEQLCTQTIAHEGGTYVDKLTSRELAKAKRLFCLTDIVDPSKSSCPIKFLYCIACGIPVIHFDWLHHSVERREVLSLSGYEVPAGKDITGEKVEQHYSKRDVYTPLNMIRIYVHTGDQFKTWLREVCFLLQKVGGEVVAANHMVTNRSKKIPFDLGNVDYVLALPGCVPEQLANACKEANVVLVTFEWLRQCVINNKLLDVVDSPLFTCK